MKNKKKIIAIISIIVILISGILYGLADRYLIEHVEVSNVSEIEEAMELIKESEITVTGSSEGIVEEEIETYIPIETSISIETVVEGSGDGKVTYYVAEVILGDDMELSTAFADDSFGSNIIDYTSSIASENNAVFAINGDYYGFRDDGIIIRNGILFRDDGVRQGLAFYDDGTMTVYDETDISGQELIDRGVVNTFSFGPGLITDGEIIKGIDEVEIDTNLGNHSIQGDQPRSGVGMIDENHFVFIVVDGRSKNYSNGMTLTDFAEVFYKYGCVEAYNLDGGGSATMYYDGELVNNPLGKDKERETSDILMIGGSL